jgi:hypothetical protein
MQDPYHYEKYLANSQFLADINNERKQKQQQYKDNMLSLEQLVLVRFSDDVLVVPKDSAWFGYWDGQRLQSMNETDLYQVKPMVHTAHTHLCFACYGCFVSKLSCHCFTKAISQ